MHVQGGEKKKCKKSVAACAYVGYLKFFFAFERYPSAGCEQCSPCCFGGVSEVLPRLSCAWFGFSGVVSNTCGGIIITN